MSRVYRKSDESSFKRRTTMSRVSPAVAEPDLDLSDDDDKMRNFNLALSEKTNAKLDRIAKDIGVTKDDVFAWAFALLELAVKARKEGKRVAIVNADNSIETVITLD
jgi:hypothetical protein